ncbi:MAG: molybdopterin converting factor subunit 1 [Rhodoferax sp.]
MKVTIKYFASIREALGRAQEQRDTQAVTLGALRDELMALGEDYALALSRGKAIRLACDQVMCDESAVLRDGAEVAFFPPVTGG